MTETPILKPVVLCILDGWGCREGGADNAIVQASTPNWDRLMQCYPTATLETSGASVGLPAGQMGNSEVGHMTIGSGRITMQSLPRIDAAVADGSFARHPKIREVLNELKASGKCLHVMGLLSDGGVHAHIAHIIALVKITAEAGINVMVHAFLDGRDVPPGSGVEYIAECEAALSTWKNAKMATISGRYYAMDRDHRWERVRLAYDAVVHAKGPRAADAATGFAASVAAGTMDEFIVPTILGDYTGVEDGDAIVMANFRADRAREILQALVDPMFDGFDRGAPLQLSAAIGMVEYSEALNPYVETLFPSEFPTNTLGEVLSARGLKQLRISETEKYAHVTFFLNGGVESVFDGEDRILVPSPDVSTYDMKPEMAAPEVTDKLVEAIESGGYDTIIVNYANTDMVGHTGNQEAAQKAVEAVDVALGRLEKAVLAHGGALLITADHGNAEQMRDEKGKPHTQHTTNVVPLVLVAEKAPKLISGNLSDLAPTVLALMQQDVPSVMTGKILIA